MIDGIIKFLVLCLGGLLIFLAGHLLLGEGEVFGRPARMAAPASSTPPQAEATDANVADLATKRVKTFPVRPDEPGAPAQKP